MHIKDININKIVEECEKYPYTYELGIISQCVPSGNDWENLTEEDYIWVDKLEELLSEYAFELEVSNKETFVILSYKAKELIDETSDNLETYEE